MSDDAELVQRNSAREMQSIDLSGRQVLMSGTALKEVGPLSSISPSRRLFRCCAHPTPTLEASAPFGRVVSPSAGPLSRHVRQRGQRNEIAVCNAPPALDRARCKAHNMNRYFELARQQGVCSLVYFKSKGKSLRVSFIQPCTLVGIYRVLPIVSFAFHFR